MEKYQIVEISEQFNHAGSKATLDVAKVARKLGFRAVPVRMVTTKEGIIAKAQRQVGYFAAWEGAKSLISDSSIVLLQHPFHYPQLTRQRTLRFLKEKQHVRYICFVHDVEKLRGFRYDDYYQQEFEDMLSLYDVLIVHNERMKQYFVEQGVPETKIVTLGIFDYLQKGEEEKPLPKFSHSISVAGNLDTQKCGYIGELCELQGVEVDLYGPNFDESLREFPQIHYWGSYPADEIPGYLTRGFGLVWDGSSIDGCQGQSGQYLRYNNPHKLSLYLSSGLPVVIWKDAAEAEFVRSHGVGLTVNSLQELGNLLNHMTEEEYRKMAMNAAELRKKLIHGAYTKKALESALNILTKEGD